MKPWYFYLRLSYRENLIPAHAYIPSEMSIQEVVQSLGVLMEAIYCIFALIILLNMIQTYYLIKKLFCQLFAQIFVLKYIYFFLLAFKCWWKIMLEARLFFFFFFLSRGSVLYFYVLHVCIFIQQNIWGSTKWFVKMVCENDQKCWQWLATFFKNAGKERVKKYNSLFVFIFY